MGSSTAGRTTLRTPLLSSQSEKGYATYNYSEKGRPSHTQGNKYDESDGSSSGCVVVLCAILALAFTTMGALMLCGVGPLAPDVTGISRKVAIIGAGASGASAAYHLAKFGPGGSYDDSLEITVFERSPVAGGRCRAVDVPQAGSVEGKLSALRIELGAPGYNSVLDPLISSLVKEVGLQDQVVQGGRWAPVSADWDLGIYNGQNLVFRQPHNPSGLWYWWTNLGYFLRYGWAHKDLESATNKLVPMWNNYAEFLSFPQSWSKDSDASRVPQDLHNAMITSANSFLESHKMRHPFSTEQVQSRTRARYGANLGVLSALQAVRVMDEARDEKRNNVNIVDGMAELFTRMLSPKKHARNARVNLKLSTVVGGIRKNQTDEGKTLGWTVAHWPTGGTSDKEPELTMEEFDVVVVAGPWSLTSMIMEPEYELPQVSWEKVHVTVFTSPRKLAPQSFGLSKGDDRGMPQRVFSTLHDSERGNLNGLSGEGGVGRTGWWSVEHVGIVPQVFPAGSEPCEDPLVCKSSIRTENVFRILSPGEISNETILRMLGSSGDNSSLTWVNRHFWEHAFHTPLPGDPSEGDVLIKIDDGLWYTGGLESVWGGVEAAVTMGRRVSEEIRHTWSRTKPLRGTMMRGAQW